MPFGIFAAIGLGIVFDSVPYIREMLPFMIASLLFFNFLKLEIKIRNFIRKEVLLIGIFTWIVFPALVYFLSKPLDDAFRIGIFVIAITPTAIGSPIVASLIDADSEMSASQVVFSNALSPLVYSFLLYLYFNNADIQVPVFAIFKKLVLIIIVPIAFSAIAAKSKVISGSLARVSKFYVPLTFIIAVFGAVSASSASIKQIGLQELAVKMLIVFALAAFLFTFGFLLPGEKSIKKSYALAFGHKNTVLAIWIVLFNFQKESIVPLILYIIFHHICNGIMVFLNTAKKPS